MKAKVLVAAVVLSLAMAPMAYADDAYDLNGSSKGQVLDSVIVKEGASASSASVAGDVADGDMLAAASVVASGNCGETNDYYTGEALPGDNVKWTLYDDNSLVLSGTGRTDFYNESDSFWGFGSPVPGWYDYRESITKITVGNGITSIGSALFAHTAITSITLPGSIKEIDQIAFIGCANLTTVNLNVGLETIGSDAFANTAVTSLYLPKTVKTIHPSNFSSGMTSVGYKHGIDLANVTIDPANTHMGFIDGALYTNGMKTLTAVPNGFSGEFVVPAGVTEIDEEAFEGKGLTGITIPDSVTKIGAAAFNISQLTELTIPDSVTELGRSVCQSTPVVKAKIGSGVKDLGMNSLFTSCESLKEVEFSEGLEKVSDRSFGGCISLEEVKLPNSVKVIGEDAFNGCDVLSSVELGPNVEEIGDKAFANDPLLTKIDLPDGLKTIGTAAFYNTGIKEIVVPDSVTSIGVDAFPENAKITIPDTLVKKPDGSYKSRDLVTVLLYEVTNGQTEARSMLSLVNAFRTGSEAWYWNDTDTEKVQVSGLANLTYDYDLEAAAQVRAAEIAALFSHTRPDGRDCFSAVTEGTFYAQGENIAYGQPTAADVVEAWKETNEDYSGQGHRRNMLSENFNAIGVGHVVINGIHCWVQEFGYTNSPNTTKPTAKDGKEKVTIAIENDKVISHGDVTLSWTEKNLETGESTAVPNVSVTDVAFDVNEEVGRIGTATVQSVWTSKDKKIATIHNERVVAGDNRVITTIATKVFGEEKTAKVLVGIADFKNLNSAIAKAEGSPYADEVTISTDGTDVPRSKKWVTASAQKDLADALAAAKKVAADQLATQEQVNAAASKLNAAMTAYVPKAGTKEGKVLPTPTPVDPDNPDKPLAPAKWTRLAGNNAFETMAAIIDEGEFKAGGTVVLASLEGYWDALTAAGIAGLEEAPVIMSLPTGLSPQATAQLAKLAPEKIIVCGGTYWLPDELLTQAAAAAGTNPDVVRLAGDNAALTAGQIASYGKGNWSDTAIVATAGTFQDALAAAPVSYAMGMPIFLAQFDFAAEKGYITADTIAAMKASGIKQCYIAGGTYWLPKSITNDLNASGIQVLGQLGGDTAVETSVAIAKLATSDFGLSANGMGVADVRAHYDALASAAFCGRVGSVLVLVRDEKIAVASAFASEHAPEIAVGFVFGGANSVSDAALSAFGAATKH